MPALKPEQIRQVVLQFLPRDYGGSPFVRSLLGERAALKAFLATPASVPAGVTGASGWIIVYIATGGGFTFELIRRAWAAWHRMTVPRRAGLEGDLALLKHLRDAGSITQEEYGQWVQELLDRVWGR